MAKKTQAQRKAKFLADLIASIENENRQFDMNRFVVDDADEKVVPTCGTASCIAGHIEAIRRPLAKKLLAECPEQVSDWWGHKKYDPPAVEHDLMAAKIYELETGEKCRLDFFGTRLPQDKWNIKASRRNAVAHIKGTSRIWPQLPKEEE
jgi:hypothetical protein